MPQHDYVIDDASGAAVRTDLNGVFQAVLTNNSGDSIPATPTAGVNHYQWYANTSTGFLSYKDGSGNNLAANYFNIAKLTGGLNVDQPSDFNGDVVFNGTHSSGLFKITFDADDTSGRSALIFNDEGKIKLGTGQDFAMSHVVGFNFFTALTDHPTIISTKTTQSNYPCLTIQTKNADNSPTSNTTESAYEAYLDAGQHLFFNGVKKFETTANGITVTGSVTATAQPACLLINPVDINVTSSDEDTPLKFATQQTNVGCTVNSDKDRITVPISGTYLITACISGEKTNNTANDSNDNILKILKNGSDAVDNSAFPRHPFGTSSSEPFSFFINMPLVLSANDYLEICLDDFSAATASVKFGYFSITKLN